MPGPPKRFAQAIGLVVTGGAALAVTLGAPLVAWILAGVIVLAASAEAFLGICVGCWIFGWLMRAGVIPQSVCEACGDVGARLAERAAAASAARLAEPSSASPSAR